MSLNFQYLLTTLSLSNFEPIRNSIYPRSIYILIAQVLTAFLQQLLGRDSLLSQDVLTLSARQVLL